LADLRTLLKLANAVSELNPVKLKSFASVLLRNFKLFYGPINDLPDNEKDFGL